MRFTIKDARKSNDKLSQVISWGHWFTLFNVLIVISIGSHYFIIADWPTTFTGRFYAIISCIGQFSFLCFAVYLILIFPVSFLIPSPSFIKLTGAIIATVGITLLLIDLAVFSRFRLHLNLTIWQILFSPSNDNPLIREWQKLFIFIPLIFLLEILFAVWIWKKLRSFIKRRKYARPVVAMLILSFLAAHIIHIWADAYFYRPITMQRYIVPLSYPMTARHFLARYGFTSQDEACLSYQKEKYRQALPIEYPIGKIQFKETKVPYNILVITVDELSQDALTSMPFLRRFAQYHLNYEHHYSASSQSDLSLFSLFYGIDANYYQSVLSTSTSSALLNTLIKQHYNLGLFSSDGLNTPLYKQALLADFSLTHDGAQTNIKTTHNWLDWFNDINADPKASPWFSWINYKINDEMTAVNKLPLQAYMRDRHRLDDELERIISRLENSDAFKNTIVIITANHGLWYNKQLSQSDSDADFNRNVLRVPLVIAWPDKVARKITTVTTHVDIMRTLMEEGLHVLTSPTKYSQGANLLALPSQRNWVIAANENSIAALYPTTTIVIDQRGRYTIYDDREHKWPNARLSLTTFLSILTENRRFLVTN